MECNCPSAGKWEPSTLRVEPFGEPFWDVLTCNGNVLTRGNPYSKKRYVQLRSNYVQLRSNTFESMQKLRKYHVILKSPKWVILNLLLFWPFHRNDKLGGAGVPWTAVVTAVQPSHMGMKRDLQKTCCAKVALCEKLFFQCARLKLPSLMGAMFFAYILTRTPHAFHLCEWMKPKFDHRILFRL